MEEEENSAASYYTDWVFKPLLGLFVCWLLYWLFYLRPQAQRYWQQGAAETCACVYDFVGLDGEGKTMVLYEYYVDSVRYESSIKGYNFPDCEDDRQCLDKRFKLRYAVKKPELHEIDLDTPCR